LREVGELVANGVGAFCFHDDLVLLERADSTKSPIGFAKWPIGTVAVRRVGDVLYGGAIAIMKLFLGAYPSRLVSPGRFGMALASMAG
jgi:hypothetical protein